MNKVKDDKGITLLALTITVFVMVIVMGTLIYNANNQVKVQKVNKLYSDIELINDKVSDYYLKYNTLPLKKIGDETVGYCSADGLVNILKANGAENSKTQDDLLDKADSKTNESTYYVIDLSKMDNLTLNYGSEYRTWTGGTEKQDLYIINEKSHHIYYPKGVLVDEKLYYSYKTEPKGDTVLPEEQYGITGLTVINTKEGNNEKRIFDYAVSVANNLDEIYIAKGGKVDLRANVLIKVPNDNSISHVYYSILEANESEKEFTECPVNVVDPDDDAQNVTYSISVLSPKMPSEEYTLWLRIIDGKGNETITDKHIQNPGAVQNVDNKVRIVEKEITLNVPTLNANPAPSLPVDSVEVTIKYAADKLSNICYGEGLTLEQAQSEYTPIASTVSYTEDQEDGERIYTLVVKEDEYLSVKAQDPYGNITTSYISLQDVLTLKEFDRNATEGKIDVVWLDTDNNVIPTPNAPVLKIKDENQVEWGLTAVDYDANEPDHWKAVADPVNTEWYKYIAQPDKVADDAEGTSRWANARANDGSLFVWIPRYAYKITYYNEDKTEILGYSTNKGIINAKGRVIYPTDENYADNYQVKTEGYRDYIVHPAFTKDAKNGGGWDNELEGIWFGKFEAVKNTTDTSVKVVAGKSSWMNLVINEMYNYGLTATYGGSNNSSNILQSHMIKNSEWGAVAYLAHSQFGINQGNIMKNTLGYITTMETEIFKSTTHNETGVFGLNGGTYIFVASYINNGSQSLIDYGNYNPNSILDYNLLYESIESESNKFKMVYKSISTSAQSTHKTDYYSNSWIRGDAIFETSCKYEKNNSWFLSQTWYPGGAEAVFFVREGGYSSDGAGMYYFGRNKGQKGTGLGFRVALCY